MNNKEETSVKKYVVFDWDGTLHDTLEIYTKSVTKAYKYLVDNGFGAKRNIESQDLKKYLGMTADNMWKDFAPGLDASTQSYVGNMVGESMVDLIGRHEARLYDGVEAMLSALKDSGYVLMILSNCKIAYLEAHRKEFKLDRWFSYYYPAQKYDYRSKESILADIVAEHPGDYYVVGDRYMDIEAGKACGLKTIGCSYGFGTSEELARADHIAAAAEDIYYIICPKI